MNANGTNQLRLTNQLADDLSPSFSPDGTKITFVSSRDAGNFEIYVMDSDGSNQVRLTNSTGST
jgi:Tol biopolymer transport system component